MKSEKYLVDEFCIFFFFFFLHLYKKWQMRYLYLTKRRWKGSNGGFSLQILNYFVDLHVWAKKKKVEPFLVCLFIKFYSERLIFSGSDSFGSKRLIWQVRSVRDNKICFFFYNQLRKNNEQLLLALYSKCKSWLVVAVKCELKIEVHKWVHMNCLWKCLNEFLFYVFLFYVRDFSWACMFFLFLLVLQLKS